MFQIAQKWRYIYCIPRFGGRKEEGCRNFRIVSESKVKTDYSGVRSERLELTSFSNGPALRPIQFHVTYSTPDPNF